MTSSSGRRSGRAGPSSGRHAVALVALAALVAVPVAAVDRTAAAFTAEASVTGTVGTVPACVGDPAGYTSGMLDAAAPLLRWSFPGAPATPDAGPAGTAAPGLLVCDPADLAAGGDAGTSATRSLDLAGGAGGGTTSAPLTTTGTASLLLWVRAEPGAADGELASLGYAPTADASADPAGTDASATEQSATEQYATAPVEAAPSDGTPDSTPGSTPEDDSVDPDAVPPAPQAAPTDPDAPVTAVPDALVLALVGDTVQLTQVHAGTTTVLAVAGLTRGAPHLVAASFDVAADGTPGVTLAVDAAPTAPPVALARPLGEVSLTVGARPSATAAVARVDEVTVLGTGLATDARQALVAADRWWTGSAAGGQAVPVAPVTPVTPAG